MPRPDYDGQGPAASSKLASTETPQLRTSRWVRTSRWPLRRSAWLWLVALALGMAFQSGRTPFAAGAPIEPSEASPASLDALLPPVEGFEPGTNLIADWDAQGTVRIIQNIDVSLPSNFDPLEPTEGQGAVMLCTGPGNQGRLGTANIDQDPDDNLDNDVASISQTFTLAPSQVPATLSFDWNWLTAESDGTFVPDPYDDFFRIKLNADEIVVGSVPGGGPSPFADVPVDGVPIEIAAGVGTCSFDHGQSGWQRYSQLLTEATTYTIEFLVADQGTNDAFIDSGLLVDNLRIEPEVDLVVSKTASPDPALPGEPVVYEITVQNRGTGRATEVEVTDVLPPEVTYVADDAPPARDASGAVVQDPACVLGPADTLTCNLGDMAGGETRSFSIEAYLDEAAVANGSLRIGNDVSVDSLNPDRDLSNNAFTLETLMEDSADLSVVKMSKPDTSIRAGEVFTYTVIVENLGPSVARSVIFTDTIVSEGDFNLAAIVDDPARSDVCTITGAPPLQNVTCELNEDLEPVGSTLGNGRWIVQMEVTAAETQDINNVVRVTTGLDPDHPSGQGTDDPNLANNRAEDFISILDTSNLALTKSAAGEVGGCGPPVLTPNSVTAGRWVTYTLTATNQTVGFGEPGGSTATNVTITDPVPPNTEVVSVVGQGPQGAAGCHVGTPGNPADPSSCNLGVLAVGESGVMTMTLLVDPEFVLESDSDLLLNSGWTRSDNIDPDVSDNTASQTTVVDAVADLQVIKDDDPDPAVAGEILSYEIVVSNAGPSTAANVTLTDRLPEGVTFLTASVVNGGGVAACGIVEGVAPSGTVLCDLGDIPPGDPPVNQRIVVINVRVNHDVLEGTVLRNEAEARSSDTPDCDLSSNVVASGCPTDAAVAPDAPHCATETESLAVADVEIEKMVEPQKIAAGEQVNYSLWITNLGPSDAQDVVVYDVLPDEVEYEIDTNSPMCTAPDNLVGLRAALSGANEVLPVVGDAAGLSTLVLDTDANLITYAIQPTDIDGVTAAHIHRGVAGVNGAVELFLFDGPPPPLDDSQPLVGEVPVSPALAAEIAANPAGFYVNVHTAANPAGEIRGQLTATLNPPLRCDIGLMPPALRPNGRPGLPDDAGTRHFNIWARVRPEIPAGATPVNVAIVTSPTEPRTPNPSGEEYLLGHNNVASAKNFIEGKSDLKVVKFGKMDDEVRAGEILTYTVIVDNFGPSWAADVVLKDVLQSSGVYDLIDISSDRDATCSGEPGPPAGTVVSGTPWPPTDAPPPFGVLPPTGVEDINQRLEVDCQLDDPLEILGAGVPGPGGGSSPGRWILTMRVRAAETQDINNVADVLSASDDPDHGNNHAEVEHAITDVADLDLSMALTGEIQVDGQPGLVFNTAAVPPFPEAPSYTTSPSIVSAGRRISTTLTVVNLGPSTAENVILRDRVPAGVSLVPGTIVPSQGSCEAGTPGSPTDTLRCGLGTLSPGAQATVSFQVLVDPATAPGAVLVNDAFVASDIFDPTNANNYASGQLSVDSWADMSLSKSSVGQNVVGYDDVLRRFIREDRVGEVTAGLFLRYEVAVQNNGPGNARNVTIRETLPEFLSLVRVEGASCRPDVANQATLYCDVGSVPVGARKTFDVIGFVDPAAPEGTILENCAEVLFAAATPPNQPDPLPPPPPVLPLTDDPFPENNDQCVDTEVIAVADVRGEDPGGELDGVALGRRIAIEDLPASPALDTPFEPDRAIAGNEHRYEVTFGNGGPSVARDVGVTILLDFMAPDIHGETFLRCETADPDDEVTCSYDPVTNIVTVESLKDGNDVVIPSPGAGTLNPGDQYRFYVITEVNQAYILDAVNTLAATDENSEPGAIARATAKLTSTTTDFLLGNNQDTERTRIIARADLELAVSDDLEPPIPPAAAGGAAVRAAPVHAAAARTTDIQTTAALHAAASPQQNAFLECDPVQPGGTITYELTVFNAGPSDAAQLYAVIWLPSELLVVDPELVNVTVVDGEVAEVRDDGRITVIVGNDPNVFGDPELGRLNTGSSATITVEAIVRLDAPCGSAATLRAQVETRQNNAMWPPIIVGPPPAGVGIAPTAPRTPTEDPDPTDNVTQETTAIECPSVAVNKTVSFDGQCPGRDITVINEPGQPVTFCYEITNTGTTYLDTIRITDTLRTRTTPAEIVFTDVITSTGDPAVPVGPGEVVSRQVTLPHMTKQCGIVTNTVEVSANPVNSGRTDLPCLPVVTAEDTATIEVPCAGVDFRLQLPTLDTEACETWVQVQNVGDEAAIPLLVVWGDPGFCPPQASGPLKAECGGLLRPGSAWSFLASQIPNGARSGVVYSLSADPIEVQPGTEIPFGALVCDTVFFNVVGDYLDWVRFDSAYRNRGEYEDLDFSTYHGEPLAVTVNRTCPDPSDPNVTVSSAYTGISSDQEGAADPRFGGFTYYSPLVFAQMADLNSTIWMQNSGVLCTSIEIWLKAQDNCLRSILGDILAVAPGESVAFDPNTVVGPGWQGSAWIRATQPLGVVVDTLAPNHFTSYNGNPGDVFDLEFSLGNQINFAPLIYSEHQGWDTAIQVQNLSSTTPAKVKAVFLDRGGGVVTTLVDWICPRGSQTFFVPVIAGLPGNWVGSARLESQEWWSPGDPVVDPPRIQSVVLLEKWDDPARTQRREAVAYNGQTECLLFDWQIGAGVGGPTSGSAVFAVPLIAKGNRGITSEVAITNLVPKPGFTDLVVFLYDQNGLVDHVCEKLNEKQVEYIDLNTWGVLPVNFVGSAVVSATFWEHEVFDPQGQFTRNLVGLAGVAVERIGGTQADGDVPGDESKAFEAFPVYDHFVLEDGVLCPGAPRPSR